MTTTYTARHRHAAHEFLPEHLDLVRRRMMPLLDHGTHYSLEHLMAEAYLQGIRDAAQALQPMSGASE